MRTLTCSSCGMTGELGMKEVRSRVLCPLCAADEARGETRRALVLAVGAALLAAVVGRADAVGSVVTMGLLGIAVVGVGVVFHELGHALVGAALGFRIITVSIGQGPRLFARHADRWSVELHLVPVGGWVLAVSDRTRGYRSRMVCLLAAGAMGNVVAAIVATAVLPGLGVHPTLVSAIVLITLVCGAAALWPTQVQTEHGLMSTDGRQILDVLALDDEGVARQVAQSDGHVRNERARQHTGDHAAIVAVTAGALDEVPYGIAAIRHLVALSNSGDHEGALRGCQRLLPRDAVEPAVRHNLLNVFALSAAILGRDDLGAFAETCADEAMASAAWSPAFQLGRGMVLAWRGDPQEAIALLERARVGMRRPAYREQSDAALADAHIGASLALAHARAGNAYDARLALEPAQRIDPGYPVVAQATRAIAAISIDDSSIS